MTTERKYFKNPYVIGYGLLRIFSGVYILINPLYGFILTLFFDALDGPLFEQLDNFVCMPMSIYAKYDKYLDWWSYVFMYIVSFQFGFSWILTALLFYRFIGQALFEINGKHFNFVIFPNLFEAYFLWQYIFPLVNFHPSGNWLLIILFAYWVREIVLHLYWPNRLRKYGYPKWQIKYFGVRKEFVE